MHTILWTGKLLGVEYHKSHKFTELGVTEKNILKTYFTALEATFRPVLKAVHRNKSGVLGMVERSRSIGNTLREYHQAMTISEEVVDLIGGTTVIQDTVFRVANELNGLVRGLNEREFKSILLTTDPSKRHSMNYLYSPDRILLDVLFAYVKRGQRIAGLPLHFPNGGIVTLDSVFGTPNRLVTSDSRELLTGEIIDISSSTRSFILSTYESGKKKSIRCTCDPAHQFALRKAYYEGGLISVIARPNVPRIYHEHEPPVSFFVENINSDEPLVTLPLFDY